MTAMEKTDGISERLSISFRLNDPQQALIYQYLKDLKNGQRAVVLARFLPPGIIAYRNQVRSERTVPAHKPNRAAAPPGRTEAIERLEPPTPSGAVSAPQTTAGLEERPRTSIEADPEEDAFLMDALTKFTQHYGGNG